MFRNPTADILVVLVIVLLFFGPKRLPALSRSIGHSVREFKDGITGGSDDSDDDEGADQLTAATDSSASGASKVGAERTS